MTERTPISYQPTGGLSYDPDEPVYWDAAGLAKEIERTFEHCHGCRMCFKFCDTFPALFGLIDRRHEGDVRQITPAETDAVLDTCFQCKLCEVNCPYTERDGHAYRLDFPKLDERLSSVQYLKFPVGGRVPVAIGVDLPGLELETKLSGEQRTALAENLAG